MFHGEEWQTGCAEIIVYSERYAPDQITQILQMKPTHTALKGELVSKALHTHAPKHFWEYAIAFDRFGDMDSALRQIAEAYLAHLEKFAQLEEEDVRISCFVNSDLAQMGFSLSAETIALIEKIGKGLQCSIFSWGGAV